MAISINNKPEEGNDARPQVRLEADIRCAA